MAVDLSIRTIKQIRESETNGLGFSVHGHIHTMG